PALNRFGAAAHLTPAADIFPTSKTLQSRSRAALIDSKMALDDSAKADPSKPLDHYSLASKATLDSFDELLARADYSTAEVVGANRAVIAGGVGRGGEYVRSVVLVESSPATVTTDKAEYSHGERPLISGSGWQPRETVRIVRQEARPGHRRKAIEVVADEKGNFTSGDISVEEFQPGVTYTLTVMGSESSYIAQTSYSDARLPGSKPKAAKLSLPMLFRDASFELEEGLLVWEMESGVRPGVKPPEMAVTNSSASETFDFTDIEDKPCFGIQENICPFPEGIDIQLKSNSFITFSGGLEGDLLAGNLKVSESVSGKLIFQVTAKQYDLLRLPLPGPGIKFNVTLGDFEASLAIGIVARVRLDFNDPGTTFTTTLDFNQNAAIAFTSEGIKPSGEITASMDFDLVETTGGCAKLSIGPEVSFEAAVSGDVCDFGVEAAANIAPFIKGCLNVKDIDTCPTYDVAFSVGMGALVEGTVSFCIFDIEGGADTEFFTIPLPFSFSGNLNDTTPPTILCPADINQETDPGSCSAVVKFPTGASDGLCAPPTVVCKPESGSVFNKGTTQVTCTATDGAGLTAQCSFNVTVSDKEAPTITCPGNLTDSNTPGQCGKTIDYALPTTADNCGQTTFSCVPDRNTFFNVGTTTVTCTVTDPAGNSNACSFTVTINDTENPTITCPSPITKGTDPGKCAAVVSFNPTAKDNCALSANAVVCSPPSGTSFAKGTTTVSCTVTDGAGLTATCSFPVTVNDTEAPALSCPPAQTRVTVRPGDPSVAVSYPEPTVSDNCSGVTFICLPPSGSIFPRGTTTVTCNATDTTGNSSSCSFTVTVFDVFVQDDSNAAGMLLWNSLTGDYRYCCAGSTYAGRGVSRVKGGSFTLAQSIGPHRITASVTASVDRGTASLQVGGVNRCPITDRNIRNNSSPCQ
ncbi:MAG TPA: HYR domain-containing protein, partial [Blastocatellia bacterium]|nr:HYR domain-containing protein [Blastocatellia bacterium]